MRILIAMEAVLIMVTAGVGILEYLLGEVSAHLNGFMRI